jgi:hypothetical protein
VICKKGYKPLFPVFSHGRYYTSKKRESQTPMSLTLHVVKLRMLIDRILSDFKPFLEFIQRKRLVIIVSLSI